MTSRRSTPGRSTPGRSTPGRSRFLLGFLLAALVIAGGLSYSASPDPDGLDSVTLDGCTVSETAAGEQLDGTCIAQNATEHGMAVSPLADYAIGGRDGTTGLAGVVGVLVTALAAGLLFRVLRRPGSGRPGSGRPGSGRPGSGSRDARGPDPAADRG